MLSSGEKIFVALAAGEFLLGILVNGFIALVNCTELVKNKKLPPSEFILISLAISKIGLLCALVWNSYLIVIPTDKPIKVRKIDIILGLAQSSDVWSTTVLSIFYFLKIANFSNPLFLWLKWRIDRMVFLLLWGPLMIYFSTCFPMMETVYYYHGSLFGREKERNVSQDVQVNKSMVLMFQVLGGLMSLIPLALSTISFSLLILSLWRHTHQMRLNATGFRDPSTEAHVRAMKAVSFFLILFFLYYICIFINFCSSSGENNKLPSMLSMSIILLYPFGHSVILILWNSKLRKAALRVSGLIRCCLRGSYLHVLWIPLKIIWHFLGPKKSV
ncbi:taste receptor type 2 member 7-like [Notamacropus eugenii]|uniref:taste receptor type 2 member 7-like n=1 Tax=Notamacropus eugenii TaxID=9315 RepID=UPI003B67D3B6